MGAKARRSRVVGMDVEGRLEVRLEGRAGACMHAVPQGRRNYMRGYVWIGDERFFAHLPTSRLLALADAIRTESSR